MACGCNKKSKISANKNLQKPVVKKSSISKPAQKKSTVVSINTLRKVTIKK